MGRAGSGSRGGGSHRSSGGHSSGSRSSGGHRMSSSRAGSSRSSFGGSSSGFNRSPSRNSFGGGNSYYRGPTIRNTTIYNGSPTQRNYSGGSGYTPAPSSNSGCSSGCLTSVIAVVVVVLVLTMLIGLCASSGSSSSVPASTVNREKLNSNVGFQNDCIVDELGWFDNISSTSRKLQEFYNETGVQPYIVLKAYDPSLTTDAEKTSYAENWYEDNIDNEATFLFMYFAEEDADNDVGFMVYVNGLEVGTVMDAEAVEIFWSYIDSLWYSDMSTDDMFVSVFNKTADRIMTKTTTSADVGKTVAIFVGIGVILVLVIVIMKTKRKHDKEENAETERILNTPLGNTVADDLADKYTNNGSDN